jgi:hypothetical protein
VTHLHQWLDLLIDPLTRQLLASLDRFLCHFRSSPFEIARLGAIEVEFVAAPLAFSTRSACQRPANPRSRRVSRDGREWRRDRPPTYSTLTESLRGLKDRRQCQGLLRFQLLCRFQAPSAFRLLPGFHVFLLIALDGSQSSVIPTASLYLDNRKRRPKDDRRPSISHKIASDEVQIPPFTNRISPVFLAPIILKATARLRRQHGCDRVHYYRAHGVQSGPNIGLVEDGVSSPTTARFGDQSGAAHNAIELFIG